MIGALAVADPRSRIYPEVGTIVSRVVKDLSLEQAARRLNYAVSTNTIRHLKNGKVGWEQTLRDFAEGFWEQLCELYGEEIRTEFAGCNQGAASDWLAAKAGFPLRYQQRAPLTYETDPENLDATSLEGKIRRLPPKDKAVAEAFIDYLAHGQRPD